MNDREENIPYISLYETRVLADVSINPSNDNSSIIENFQDKLSQYTNSLISSNLSPSKMIIGYNTFWWPSIKFIAPTLTLDPLNNLLQKFYQSLLPRLGINQNIPKVLISIPFYIGGFQLKALEIEQCIESISTIITYFSSPLSTANLLKHSLEYL